MAQYIIVAIGLVCVIEGLPYFCFPGTVKKVALKVQEMHLMSLRIFGIILMICGLLLIYYGRGFFS